MGVDMTWRNSHCTVMYLMPLMYLHHEECFIDQKRIQNEFVSASTFTRQFSRLQRVPVEVVAREREERERERERDTNLSPAGFEPAPPEEDCPQTLEKTNAK